MDARQAIAFVRKHGVVVESASGPVPSLAAAVAGAPIRGSWWAHAASHEIFAVTRAVRSSPDVLVCRAVRGKVTFVHRRLWPALVAAAKKFPQEHLAQVAEVHTSSGKHVARDIPFPEWVPREVAKAATRLSESQALATLGVWTPQHSGRAVSRARRATRGRE
jgi:hypothetical protein